MKKKYYLYSIVLILGSGVLFSFSRSLPKNYFEIAKSIETFASLFQEVNTYYVEDINPNELMQKSLKGMLNSLDPYTTYIPEELIETYRTQNTGQYAGIGATTRTLKGKIFVTMLIDGFPAKRNGLMIGDEIIKVNDIDITSLDPEETDRLLKGPVNSQVTLSVKRFNHKELLSFSFKREKVQIKNVPYWGMINSTTGYINLTEFTINSGMEVRGATEKLIQQGATRVILDLRNNPGGLLIEAVNVINVFIPKGKEVVTTRGKIEKNNAIYKTLDTPVNTEIPIAVLINNGSASASEIVAGTLQDYDRGIVVGSKSYGKGLVQVTRPLSYNAQLKVTIAKYYTPSGRCIQALDYSHRNEDGSVGKIPDSLINTFNTSNGRKVYDGGGIDPDVKVEQDELPEIAISMLNNGLIFEYATEYFYQNKTARQPTSFSISDLEYQNFTEWTKKKTFSYTLQVEHKIKALQQQAVQEKYDQKLSTDIHGISEKIQEQKKKDLEKFKNNIVTLLEQEIISRYHLEKGKIEYSIHTDNCVQLASKILNDSPQYKEVLKSTF